MDDRDLVLVSRCLMGDATAYHELYAARAAAVMAYFVRCGFGPVEAEDLTQETFIRAFKSLEGFDAQKGYFQQWLGAIARNVARRKWEGRRGGADANYDAQVASSSLAGDEAADPARRAEDREAMEALEACIAGLSDADRQIVRLRYVEAMSTRGIAQTCGIPESTVRLRLDEARRQLAKCMKGRGVDL